MNSDKIRAFAELSRPMNVAITFVAIPVASILSGGTPSQWLSIILGAVTGSLVAAGANAINDFFDVEIDRINRPDRPIPRGALAPAEARNFWLTVSVVAITLNIFINPLSLGIAVAAVVILYYYSARFKATVVAGNLVVALMTGMAFVYGAGVVGHERWGIMPGIFAFLANAAREVIKDVEDLEGDRRQGAGTLPVRFGVSAALWTATAILVLLIATTAVAHLLGIYGNAFLYCVLGVDAALVVVIVGIWRDPTPRAMGNYSQILKYCMIGGLAAIVAGSL